MLGPQGNRWLQIWAMVFEIPLAIWPLTFPISGLARKFLFLAAYLAILLIFLAFLLILQTFLVVEAWLDPVPWWLLP